MNEWNEWYDDRGELVAFGEILRDYFFWSSEEVLYYVLKPWKWTPEHDDWVGRGRPTKNPELELFHKVLEKS